MKKAGFRLGLKGKNQPKIKENSLSSNDSSDSEDDQPVRTETNRIQACRGRVAQVRKSVRQSIHQFASRASVFVGLGEKNRTVQSVVPEEDEEDEAAAGRGKPQRKTRQTQLTTPNNKSRGGSTSSSRPLRSQMSTTSGRASPTAYTCGDIEGADVRSCITEVSDIGIVLRLRRELVATCCTDGITDAEVRPKLLQFQEQLITESWKYAENLFEVPLQRLSVLEGQVQEAKKKNRELEATYLREMNLLKDKVHSKTAVYDPGQFTSVPCEHQDEEVKNLITLATNSIMKDAMLGAAVGHKDPLKALIATAMEDIKDEAVGMKEELTRERDDLSRRLEEMQFEAQDAKRAAMVNEKDLQNCKAELDRATYEVTKLNQKLRNMTRNNAPNQPAQDGPANLAGCGEDELLKMLLEKLEGSEQSMQIEVAEKMTSSAREMLKVAGRRANDTTQSDSSDDDKSKASPKKKAMFKRAMTLNVECADSGKVKTVAKEGVGTMRRGKTMGVVTSLDDDDDADDDADVGDDWECMNLDADAKSPFGDKPTSRGPSPVNGRAGAAKTAVGKAKAKSKGTGVRTSGRPAEASASVRTSGRPAEASPSNGKTKKSQK